MRQRVVLGILVGMFITFGVILVDRHSGDVETGDEQAEQHDETEELEPIDEEPEEEVEPEDLDRPLRVVSTSWDLMSPGLFAGDADNNAEETDLFAEAGVETDFSSVDDADAIQEALSRGGADEEGADVAVMSLPAFAASYEQLRALQPVVFYVVGWSRGREALASQNAEGLVDADTGADTRLRGQLGEPGTFFGLYLLQLAGIDAGGVDVSLDVPETESGSYSAISRGHPELETAPDGFNPVITTADTEGLIPYVAVTSDSFLRAHLEELTSWADVWQQGRLLLDDDVPAAARTVAEAADDFQAVDLVDMLGVIELATIRDNARMAGLAGRAPMVLDRQFELAWDIWRDVGVLSTPRPDQVPIATEVIMTLVRESDDGDVQAAPETFEQTPPTDRTLLEYRHRGTHHDEEAMMEQVATLAGVFNQSAIEVALGDHTELTEQVLDEAAERFELDRNQLIVGERPHREGVAHFTVYAPQ